MSLYRQTRARLRKLLPWGEGTAYFYNLRVGRSLRQVTKELEAMAADPDRPVYIGLVEALGYALPELEGYVIVRDTSTPSRENVAAYVREDQARPGVVNWTDLEQRWKRTQRPGVHEPRSFPTFPVGRMPVTVAHAAPLTKYRDTRPAQMEMVEALVPILDPLQRKGWTRRTAKSRAVAAYRPRHLVWDANRQPGETGPGPTMLAELVGGLVVGSRIDGAVLTQTQLLSVTYPRSVGGVVLKSDHPYCLRFRFRVWGYWLR